MTSNSLLSQAMAYARQGWYIHPLHTIRNGQCTCGRPDCGSAGKHPRIKAWETNSSIRGDTIQRWWAQWPDSNIGLNCGKSGLVVIDTDRHSTTADGVTLWRELCMKHSIPDDTLTVHTGGKGMHLYYRPAPGQIITNSDNGLPAGINIRGKGGQVVLPPSLHPSGNRYTWANESPVLELPPALYAMIHRKPEGEPDPWQFLTLGDAYAPRAPVEYSVSGLFALPSLNMVFGAPGTLKSLLMADCAVCVAAGLPWLAPLPELSGTGFDTLKASSMFLDFDNGTSRTLNRFEALGKGYRLPSDLPLHYISMPAPWLDATSTESIGYLAERIVARQAKLVVIDNLGTVSGGSDENTGQMIKIMSHFRALADKTGTAIVLIHHQRKAPAQGMDSRMGDTLRGHSSIEAALDLALRVTREERAGSIEVHATKVRGVDVAPFGALFTFEHKPDSDELASARFFGQEVEDTQSDFAVRRVILEVVAENRPINQTRLKELVRASCPDAGLNRISHLANRLVAKGNLTSSTGKHGAIQYDLGDRT